MSGDRYRISDQNEIYFLTFTVVDWVDVFTRKEHKLVIVESLDYCIRNKGLIVYVWCLMSNHIHLIAAAKANYRLSDIIRDFKKHVAKTILKNIELEPESRRDWMLYRFKYAGKYLKRVDRYKFWKEGNRAILLNTTFLIQQKVDYIHQNPVKALIVSEPEQYLFSSAIDYAGGKGMIECTLLF